MKVAGRGASKERIARTLVVALCENLIAAGYVDPSGKSDEELVAELEAYVLQCAAADKIMMSTDFTGELLKEARRFSRRTDREVSCLFYATWFEHWVNGVIAYRGIHSSLERGQIRVLIRDVSLKAKLSCLPQLLGVPPLASRHIRAIIRLAEVRNGFVHYKHEPQDVDLWPVQKQQLLKDLQGAERAVRYCQGYASQHVYKGAKRRLRTVLAGRPGRDA